MPRRAVIARLAAALFHFLIEADEKKELISLAIRWGTMHDTPPRAGPKAVQLPRHRGTNYFSVEKYNSAGCGLLSVSDGRGRNGFSVLARVTGSARSLEVLDVKIVKHFIRAPVIFRLH